ncbi:MAG: hypothetical protein AB1941_23855 [Gemmatimonadota bacterium]
MTGRWIAALAGAAVLAGCSDRGEPTSPEARALFSCVYGPPPLPEVGEVVQVEGAAGGTLCLAGGEEGAEYVYVPFFAADDGEATLAVEVEGGAVSAPAGPPLPSLAAAEPLLPDRGGLRPDDLFHHRLRLREIRELGPLLAGAPLRRAPARSRGAAPAPAVGELVTFSTSTDCDSVAPAVGRVEAVSRTAVVVADTSNPAGGFTRADWEAFATAMDTLVYPVDVLNFGEPTDVDGNGRVFLFFTRAVNELTPPASGSYVGGFFWGGDLLPRGGAPGGLPACPGGNSAEMFYLLVPDSAGEVNRNPRSADFVRRRTVGVVAHELQHLINAGRRIYVSRAGGFEEVWLNEALSHAAEELMFYRTTGLAPRQNIGLEELRRSEHVARMFSAYAADNFARFRTYLLEPDAESLLGIDELPTRGAAWAFLRYAADHREGEDAALFRRLVDGPEAGLANLRSALGTDPLDLIQAWTVSVYTDDAVLAVPPAYRQPSWDFRSVMPVFAEAGGYPLRVVQLGPGEPRAVTLRGGGAAFVRFAVPPSRRAFVRTRAEGARPDGRLRISVVRTR